MHQVIDRPIVNPKIIPQAAGGLGATAAAEAAVAPHRAELVEPLRG